MQNVTIPCHSQELLPFLPVIYPLLPPFSTKQSSILPHLILPTICWSTSQPCCIQIRIYKTFLRILFSSIRCKCPNHNNLFNLILYDIMGFLTNAYISLLDNIVQFSFSFSYTMPKILLYTFFSNLLFSFLCFFVSIQVSDV